jgi:predicted MFS family arabinose efflux permease
VDPDWIALAFGTVNSIRVVFYLPQIVAVARSTSGARDIALSTWAMWALTNGLGAAYGAVVVHDSLLALSFALSLLACVLTMVLTVVQRVRWARGMRAHGRVSAVHSPLAS